MRAAHQPGMACLLIAASLLAACGGGGGGGGTTSTQATASSNNSVSSAAATSSSSASSASSSSAAASSVSSVAVSSVSSSTSSSSSSASSLIASTGANGWASYGSGTTGGTGAAAGKIYTVTTRAQLIQALYGNSTTINTNGSISGGTLDTSKKIIYVSGTISLNTNAAGTELTEADYICPVDGSSVKAAYTFDAYKTAYDPNSYGISSNPSGDLETARICAMNKQKAVVKIKVPSNTSLIGLGNTAKIVHGTLSLASGTDNVVIRNISFEDSFDFFPGWEGQDSGGRWNSQYDLISVEGATHVWIDHCEFSDGSRYDKLYPSPFASPYNTSEMKIQHHDGLVDVTKSSDYVTLSWNHFHDHDKSLLIGSTETASTTAENPSVLKVTLHHNHFQNLKQRQPLVRYGVIHLYNNYFSGDMSSSANYPWSVAWSQAQGAKLYVENNALQLSNGSPTGANVYKGSSGSKTSACVSTTGTSTEYCSAYAWHAGNVLNGNALDSNGAVNGVSTTGVTVSNTPWFASGISTGAPTASPASFYTYSAEATSNLATTVPAGAGSGKL